MLEATKQTVSVSALGHEGSTRVGASPPRKASWVKAWGELHKVTKANGGRDR